MGKVEQSYFSNVKAGISSMLNGIVITFRHFRQASQKRKPFGVEHNDYFVQQTGIVTTEYPYESIPVPDNGRYRLSNEIDDCIVCDLCAKICPVNCIDIVPVKSPEEIGKTSDGTTKRIYAATFDIDMAKCCYCGLCTTVCPTECLTMTKTFDYSEFDIRNMTYHFSDLSPQEAEEKKDILEEYQRLKKIETEKAKQLKENTPSEVSPKSESSSGVKPAFKPVVKPFIPKPAEGNEASSPDVPSEPNDKSAIKKPAFKPSIKGPSKEEDSTGSTKAPESSSPESIKPKPMFKPVIKPLPKKDDTNS